MEARNSLPAVIWITGLSGAGKTTLALALERRLRAKEVPVEVLDGDQVRDLLGNTGYSREERNAHVRSIGFMASRLEAHGVTVVVALVSPYAEAREFARRMCRRFIEIHLATPLEICEKRDSKGLYARARRGELKGFTGIDSPYEEPARPELRLDGSSVSPDAAAARILDEVLCR